MGCGSSTYNAPREIPSKWFQDFEKDLPSLEGKVFVITGCTTGTGLVAAKTAAKKGAHVVMLNRRSDRATAAEKAVLEVAGGEKVTSVDCDLQDMESVKAASEKLKVMFQGKGIDVLCNNAGVMALEDKATKDGYDVQMQTNHLSHFMLTKELQPTEAKLVNHSSGGRKYPTTDLGVKYLQKNGGNLGGNGASMFFGGARWQRYHQTKLANAVFTVAMDERLRAANSRVKSCCAAPGLAATNLQVTASNDGGFSTGWIMKYGQSGEDGTMPLLRCCAGLGVESGDFYEPEGRGNLKGLPKKYPLEKICTKPQSCKILWEESEKACGDFKIE